MNVGMNAQRSFVGDLGGKCWVSASFVPNEGGGSDKVEACACLEILPPELGVISGGSLQVSRKDCLKVRGGGRNCCDVDSCSSCDGFVRNGGCDVRATGGARITSSKPFWSLLEPK